MQTSKQYLTWTPRVIATAFAGLLTLFAFDAFEGSTGFGDKLGAFVMHLLPALITIACLAVAWRYRLWGGILFLFLGIVFTFYFGTARNLYNFLLISAPLFAAGVLFLLSARAGEAAS